MSLKNGWFNISSTPFDPSLFNGFLSSSLPTRSLAFFENFFGKLTLFLQNIIVDVGAIKKIQNLDKVTNIC